jgi:phenylacetate-CoA ligase
MPLVRYRIGDLGILGDVQCPCGRGFPLLRSVEGRIADCFQLPNGTLVTPKTIATAVQGTPGVSRYQVVQESMNKIKIDLMSGKSDPNISIDELKSRCYKVLGDSVEIEVSIGDRKGLKAKFRPVISKLTVAAELRWTKPKD